MEENLNEAILPDDFGTEPQEEPQAEQQIDVNAEETTPAETQQEQPRIKVKFNHEEKELGIDEAIPYVQKGMNYDKLQERLQELESDPRLSFIEEMASQFNMTGEEYIQAVKQSQEEEQLNQLIQQNIPEELAKEIMENKKFRQQVEKDNKARQQEEKQKQDMMDFIREFPDVKGDQIPDEVWSMAEQGIPLKYAYMQHDYNNLKNQISILKQNQQNQQQAPVNGATQHGSVETAAEDDFLAGFNSI